MKHVLRWCAALVALALALPAQAAEATKISFQQNAKLYRGGSVTSWATGNPGINGSNYAADLFDGNFANYVYQNTAGAYLVIDLTPICEDPDGQPYVTDVLVGHAGNTKYSLYYTTEEAPAEGSTSDDRTWTPIVEQTQAGGTKTYGVNAVATAIKYVWDTSLGWGGQSLAEIEVQGYEYVPPKVLKISSLNRFTLYRGGTATKGNFTLNGTSESRQLFDGDFTTYLYQNTAGAYCVLDTTVFDENDVSTGNGYYVTDILIGHAGNTKYSLYYTTEEAPAVGATSDDRTWIPIIEQTQAGGTKTYGVNAIATAVKYVWDTSLGWGGTSLAEIEIWGMDPSTIACLHPNLDSVAWVPVPDSYTCTEFGYMTRACPDCGEVFTTEDPDQPPAHVYEAHLTTPGTVAAYGTGYYECTNCHDRVDFSEPDNLVRSANASLTFGPLVPGQVIFTTYTVSSVWHSDWGIKAADMFNGSWTMNYTCWATGDLNDQGVDLYFGAPIDLTSVDVAAHNHNHTLQFYNVDDATGTKTLIGEQVVVKAESGEEQRFLVPLYGDTVSTHLYVTTANDSGYEIWGSHGMCIVELEPYGTIPGANKLEPTVRIGLDGYDSLADAVAAATNGNEVITLQKSVSEDVVIPAGQSMTIDLNGHSITNVASDTISVYGTLTLKDTAGGGEIVSVLSAKADLVNYPTGTVTIQGGTFAVPDNATYYNIKNMGAMTIGGNATVLSRVSTASTLIANGWYGKASIDRGTSGQANTAILTINGGSFSGGMNVVKNDDYGVLTITGGTFANASTTDAVILNWNEATISGGAFTGATKVLCNGSYGAESADKGVMTISGGTFTQTGTGETDTLFGYGRQGGQMADALIEISGGTFYGAVNGLGSNDGTCGHIAISGGSFDEIVRASYCAAGYAPVTDADETTGLYTVKPVYTVTFVNEKGEAPAAQVLDVVEGQDLFATEPDPAPAAEGFTFLGWFAPEAETAFDFANTPITGDLTLTAAWEEIVAELDPVDVGAGLAGWDWGAEDPKAPMEVVPADGADPESLVVRFVGKAGVTYQLVGSATLSLDEDGWLAAKPAGEAVTPDADGIVELVAPMDAAVQFFKIKASK